MRRTKEIDAKTDNRLGTEMLQMASLMMLMIETATKLKLLKVLMRRMMVVRRLKKLTWVQVVMELNIAPEPGVAISLTNKVVREICGSIHLNYYGLILLTSFLFPAGFSFDASPALPLTRYPISTIGHFIPIISYVQHFFKLFLF